MFRQFARGSVRLPPLSTSTLQKHSISHLTHLTNDIFNPSTIPTTISTTPSITKSTVFPRQPSSHGLRTRSNGNSPHRNSIPNPHPPTLKSHRNLQDKPILDPVSPNYFYNPKSITFILAISNISS